MTKYAHVKDGAVFKLFDLTAEEIALIPSHKQSYILPYITVSQPAYDSATHYAPVKLPDIIGSSDVSQAWAKAVAKTAGELDAEKEAVLDRSSNDPFIQALFDEINALRSVVVPPLDILSEAEFRASAKAKLP